MIIRLNSRRETPLNWETLNPVLGIDEIGAEVIDADTLKFKIGDGINRWLNLPYSEIPSSNIDNSALNSHIENLNAHGLNEIRNTLLNLDLSNILNKEQVTELINNEAQARATQITNAINIEANDRQSEIELINTELQNTNSNLNQANEAIWGAENKQGILNGAYGIGKITELQNILPKKIIPISQDIEYGNIVIKFSENLGHLVTFSGQLVYSIQGATNVNVYIGNVFVNFGAIDISIKVDSINELRVKIDGNQIIIKAYNNNVQAPILSIDHLQATYVSFPIMG